MSRFPLPPTGSEYSSSVITLHDRASRYSVILSSWVAECATLPSDSTHFRTSPHPLDTMRFNDNTVSDKKVNDNTVNDNTVNDNTVNDNTVNDKTVNDNTKTGRADTGRPPHAASSTPG